MPTTYRLRSSTAKHAASNHRLKSAAISAAKKAVSRGKAPLAVAKYKTYVVDKCVKPKAARAKASCETVAKVTRAERWMPSRAKGADSSKGSWKIVSKVAVAAKTAPAPTGTTEAVLNGAGYRRRR